MALAEQEWVTDDVRRRRPRAVTGPVAKPRPIDVLFAAVTQHSGSVALADDATALVVRW